MSPFTEGSIGLANVRRLCALLGRRLALQSREGQGSVFSLMVPRSMEREAPAAEAHAQTGAALRIVMIEDDAQVLEGMRVLLERWGHFIVAVSGVQELPDALMRPRAVISDLRLQAGDSRIDVVTPLRRRWDATLPALIVTGESHAEPLHALQASGMPWVAKPAQPVRLRSWLASITSRPLAAVRMPPSG